MNKRTAPKVSDFKIYTMAIIDKYDIFYDEDNKAYQVRTKSDVIVIEFVEEEKEKIFLSIIELYNEKLFIHLNNLGSVMR